MSPGGFRTWWQQLFASDENLDDNHLMRRAGREMLKDPWVFGKSLRSDPASNPESGSLEIL